ncbi:MAG: hypothetical protein NTZ50_10600 [Chloroflexi bacterium]|nr:hypothetical protein [Chloroflexota bacterium]
MTKSKGVLTMAQGHARYARLAVNLARSIRLRDPDLPLAVATDLDPALFEGAFDHVIRWDFSRRSGFTSKLEAYAITPFEATLLLDSDMLAYRSLSLVFEQFEGDFFGVIRTTDPPEVVYGTLTRLRELFPEAHFPAFNGALYYFVKNEKAAQLFQVASARYEQYDELQLKRLHGQRNEEALFGLAMAERGIMARPARRNGIVLGVWFPFGHRLVSDVVAGTCHQLEGNVCVSRVFLHYFGGSGGLTASHRYILSSCPYVLSGRFASPAKRGRRICRQNFWRLT